MMKNKRRRIRFLLMISLIICIACSGCGQKQDQDTTPVPLSSEAESDGTLEETTAADATLLSADQVDFSKVVTLELYNTSVDSETNKTISMYVIAGEGENIGLKQYDNILFYQGDECVFQSRAHKDSMIELPGASGESLCRIEFQVETINGTQNNYRIDHIVWENKGGNDTVFTNVENYFLKLYSEFSQPKGNNYFLDTPETTWYPKGSSRKANYTIASKAFEFHKSEAGILLESVEGFDAYFGGSGFTDFATPDVTIDGATCGTYRLEMEKKCENLVVFRPLFSFNFGGGGELGARDALIIQ